MYIYTYTYMYTHMYVDTLTHTHTDTHTHIDTLIHTRTDTRTHVYMHNACIDVYRVTPIYMAKTITYVCAFNRPCYPFVC